MLISEAKIEWFMITATNYMLKLSVLMGLVLHENESFMKVLALYEDTHSMNVISKSQAMYL
jgi:hypothetical protein